MSNSSSIDAYHRASTHRLQAYAPGPGQLNWATQPDPFRRFHGAPRTELPFTADALTTSYSAVRTGAAVPARPVDVDGVAALLELSFGLSAWKQYGASRWALRCNPSSGNLHPTEAYVVCGALPGLAAGVLHYCSVDHVLEQRALIDHAAWNALLGGGILVGLSTVFWREAWKYGLRAYRYCNHDAGHAIAAVRYAAAALGWQVHLLDAWGDDDVERLLGLTRTNDFPVAEEREAAEVLLWVGETPTDLCADALLALIEHADWRGTASRLSTSHRLWPGIDEVAAAARKPRTPMPVPLDPPALPVLAPAPTDVKAARLVRQRRSAVAFDGVTYLDRPVFFAMLDALLPRAHIPPWDTLPWTPGVHPVLFVHRVHGLAPGLYLLLRNAAALDHLRAALRDDVSWQRVEDAPAHLPLYVLAEDDTRRLAEFVSCHQEIAADSAFSLGMLARFDDTLARGPWWYRRLHWEAGMLGQVLYLEAEANGVRGTGIGCFFDDEVHELLGLTSTAYRTLYHFTVGGAVEDTRLATLAGYAHLAERHAPEEPA